MTRPTKTVESYMPLWISDYLGDTTRLTYPLHGAYLLLLMSMWREGGTLPDCDDELAAIIGAPVKEWRKDVRPRLERFFRITDGAWTHKRVDEELSRAKAIRARKAEAGAKGAASRWQQDGTAIAEPLAEASREDAILPSPSPVSTNVETLGAAKPRSEKPAKQAGKTLLPSDWTPHAEHRAKAAALQVDCDLEAEKMRHWADSGGARCQNWDARFFNWLIKAAEFGNGRQQNHRVGTAPGRGKPAISAGWLAGAVSAIEDLQGGGVAD